MKTLPILFFTSVVLLFYSCEVPKEKVIEKEVVPKTNISDKLKKIYEMYGCLNKDNFKSNGFDEDGKEKFILYVNGKYINMTLECDTIRCWLSDKNGECSFRTRYKFIKTSKDDGLGEERIEIPKEGYYQINFEFSCDELFQGVYFNESSNLSNQKNN